MAALTRELATWLEAPDPDRVHDDVEAWSAARWAAFRRVVVMHGLAPHLAHNLPVAGAIPPETADWLAEQDRRNRLRIDRMHEELAAILEVAAAGGLEVMPLKGALLTTTPGGDKYRRPMADLDLLVRPPDRARLGRVLEGLGYRHEPQGNPRPTHDVFIDPGGGRILSSDGEHPDNPRRVEVHVEVMRHLWGWADDDDLTPALWAGSRAGEVLGQPAVMPAPRDLFAHVAIHASSDLLVGRGRLVQWLDLGHVASIGGDLAPHPAPAGGLSSPCGLPPARCPGRWGASRSRSSRRASRSGSLAGRRRCRSMTGAA